MVEDGLDEVLHSGGEVTLDESACPVLRFDVNFKPIVHSPNFERNLGNWNKIFINTFKISSLF